MKLPIIEKLTVVQKSKTYEIVLEQIRNLIISGDILPGEKLPGERDLSKRLNVSRASVRIAIKLLEFMDLVEVRPGSGIFVANSQPNQRLMSKFEELEISQQHPLLDLIEARKDIEPYMAGIAAERASEKDIDSMQKVLNEMETAVQRGTQWIDRASQFHLLISQATHNIILYRIGALLQDLMNESKEISLREKKRASQSVKEHQALLKAIQAHNSDLAKEKMKIHLSNVEKLLKKAGIKKI